MDEKYYSTSQAAKEFNVTEQTIRNAINRGKLKALQITNSSSVGFSFKIAESDLKKWVENRKARKTIIPNVSETTIDDIAEDILKRIKNAYNEGYKAGKKAAKDEFMSALKGVK